MKIETKNLKQRWFIRKEFNIAIKLKKKIIPNYSLLWRGKRIFLKEDECYNVSMNNQPGVVKVVQLWLDKVKECFIKIKLYQTPSQVKFKEEESKYGKDELIEYHLAIILSTKQFCECLTQQYTLERGTLMIKKDEIITRRIKNVNYIGLRNPIGKLKDNLSASVQMRRLLGNINQPCECGSTKKSFSNIQTRSAGQTCLSRDENNYSFQQKSMVLSFEEYCWARKGKKGLESGIFLPKEEAIFKKILHSRDTHILFSREFFHDASIHRLYQTERVCSPVDIEDEETNQDKIDDKIYQQHKNNDPIKPININKKISTTTNKANGKLTYSLTV